MDVETARPKVARTHGATALLVAAGLAALATFVILVLPNSVEVGPSKAVFFDCGTALSPSSDPAKDPGISACKNANEQMRTAASVSALTSLVCGIVAAAGYYVRRNERRRVR